MWWRALTGLTVKLIGQSMLMAVKQSMCTTLVMLFNVSLILPTFVYKCCPAYVLCLRLLSTVVGDSQCISSLSLSNAMSHLDCEKGMLTFLNVRTFVCDRYFWVTDLQWPVLETWASCLSCWWHWVFTPDEQKWSLWLSFKWSKTLSSFIMAVSRRK